MYMGRIYYTVFTMAAFAFVFHTNRQAAHGMDG
jgi:hypothetical protein